MQFVLYRFCSVVLQKVFDNVQVNPRGLKQRNPPFWGRFANYPNTVFIGKKINTGYFLCKNGV